MLIEVECCPYSEEKAGVLKVAKLRQLKKRVKTRWIVFDQIRTVAKKRLTKRLGAIDRRIAQNVKSVIKEMLVD